MSDFSGVLGGRAWAEPNEFVATTEGYIREAENLAHGFGEVFPLLPYHSEPQNDAGFRRRFRLVPIALLAKNEHASVQAPGIENGASAH